MSVPPAPRVRLLIHAQDGCLPYLTPQLLDLLFSPSQGGGEIGSGDGEASDKLDNDEDWKWRRAHLLLGVAVKDTCIVPMFQESKMKSTAASKRKRDADSVSSADGKIGKPGEAVSKNDAANRKANVDDTKKPVGYTFLTPGKAEFICSEIREHAKSSWKEPPSASYAQIHLKIPSFVETIIAPSFSLDGPSERRSDNGVGTREKIIPQSTKNAMQIDTPHGWQKIQPEQYWRAVMSVTGPPSSSEEMNLAAGAVGLFDLVSLNRADSPSREKMLKRTNDWSSRIQSFRASQKQPCTGFWTPVHLSGWDLPLESLLARPNRRDSTPSIDRVAIVGWESITSTREHRRQCLRRLMGTLNSSPSKPKEYALLAVNDIESIVDAANEGVSIIGTDLLRRLSLSGLALCLDLTDISSSISSEQCYLDLKDRKFAEDASPIVESGGCKVTSSFSRAYIHHLIEAKEMLAQTLLFIHNLNQMLLLFRQMSHDSVQRDE